MILLLRRDGTELATIDAPSVRAAVASHLAAGGTLIGADLAGAILTGAVLERARLDGADLRGADLELADLRDADLAGANLSGANLAGANLADADLSEADLGGTCLDPAAPVPDATAGLLAAGLRIADGWVYAWRTATSTHVGATDYSKPGEYAAPWFSVAVYTDCHPGIYFGHLDWLTSVYPYVPIVAIRARVAETVATRGGKFRARRIEVLP